MSARGEGQTSARTRKQECVHTRMLSHVTCTRCESSAHTTLWNMHISSVHISHGSTGASVHSCLEMHHANRCAGIHPPLHPACPCIHGNAGTASWLNLCRPSAEEAVAPTFSIKEAAAPMLSLIDKSGVVSPTAGPPTVLGLPAIGRLEERESRGSRWSIVTSTQQADTLAPRKLISCKSDGR